MEINRSNSQVRHSRILGDPRSGGSGGRPEGRSEETQNGPPTRETVRMSIPSRVDKRIVKNEETCHERIKKLEKMYANLQKDLGSKIEMGDAVVKHLNAYKSKFLNNR